MSYAVVENFKGGLDRSGSQLTGPPGTLWTLVNAHLNRRGEIDRRKKFVAKYSSVLAGTFGCHALNDALYVFGSIADPGVPVGITYQRLQHPDGSTAMSSLVSAKNYDGKIYAIAQFADGNKLHFYDGTLVSAWTDGIVRTDFTNNAGIAMHLKNLVDADADYSASVVSNVITITGPTGTAFTVTTKAENVDGGTNDQAAAVANTVSAVAGVSETLATGSFSITAGADVPATGSVELTGGASGSVDGITVNGVQIMSGAESFDTSLSTTATNVAANITAYTSSPNYTAVAVGAVITITAAAGTGTSANTFAVVSSATTITTSDTNMSGGVAHDISSVTVDGIEILGSTVPWVTSNSVMAANVASAITSYTSSPNYSASSDGATVTISGASGSGATPNTLTIGVSVTGSVTTDTPTAMAGGVDAVSGQAQQTTVTISGTFEVGDRFSIIITEGSAVTKFGADGNPEKQGDTLLTFKGKVHSTASSLLFFCSVNGATLWNRDDTNNPGASFINMAAQDEGSQSLTALAVYQGLLAVFARNTIQIWSIDADPTLNVFLQTLQNTGTRSKNSVISYGDNDVFYLADSGIRSLKARDSSNAAYVSDVGTPIDPLVTAFMDGLTDARVQAAASVLEPIEDRFWIAIGNRIFVFTYFPGAKISAWSYYDTTDDIGGDISFFARTTNQLFARSGDVIYLYGGDNNDTYPDDDEVVVTVELPFLSADKPATLKNFSGFDVGCENSWLVELLVDPNDTTVKLSGGVVTGTTYAKDKAAFNHAAPLVAPKLTCSTAGFARLSNLAVHWDGEAEDA